MTKIVARAIAFLSNKSKNLKKYNFFKHTFTYFCVSWERRVCEYLLAAGDSSNRERIWTDRGEYDSSLHVLASFCSLTISNTLPETAQTENEYEQIEVTIYVRFIPARLSLYLYTENTLNTLPETAPTEKEYEKIEVKIYIGFVPTRLCLYFYTEYFNYFTPDSSTREWIWTDRGEHLRWSIPTHLFLHWVYVPQIPYLKQLQQIINRNRLRWTFTYNSFLYVFASIFTLSTSNTLPRQLKQRMNMNRKRWASRMYD